MTPTVVVARFKESLDWIDKVPEDFPIWVVNMGPQFATTCARRYDELKVIDAGRESFAYCSWIVANYKNLPPWTVFCQGHPYDHMAGIGFEQWLLGLKDIPEDQPDADMILAGEQRVCKMDERMPTMSRLLTRSPRVPYELDAIGNGYFLARHPLMTLWTWLIGPGVGTPYPEWRYCFGNQFAVRRELIQRKPIEFWARMITCLEHAPRPLEACLLERMWVSILKKEV